MFLLWSRAPPHLPSFPTRRSSDLVTGEQPMPAGEQVALQQALAHMFRQHLDHPAVAIQPDVEFADLGLPVAAGDLQNIVQPVARSEEHTSELQSRENLVCRLLLEN